MKLQIQPRTQTFLLSLGCPENAKSLKSQAPQGFSDCLDIDNDEMKGEANAPKFIVLPYEAPIMKKMFGPKNGTSKPQNGLSFNIYHDIEPLFEKNICFKLYHQGARISTGQ